MNIFRLAGDMAHLVSVLLLLLKIYATKSCSGISLKTQELYALVFLARYLDLFTDFISIYNTAMKLIFIASSLATVWCMRAHPVVRRSYDGDQDTFRHHFLVLLSFILALLFHDLFTIREVFWAFSIYLEAVAVLPQLVLLQRSRNVDNLTAQYIFFLGYVLQSSSSFFLFSDPILVHPISLCSSRLLPPPSLRFPSISLSLSLSFSLNHSPSTDASRSCQSDAIIAIDSSSSLLEDQDEQAATALPVPQLSLVPSRSYRALYVLNWIYRYITENHAGRWISWMSGLVQTTLYVDFFYYYFMSWKTREKLRLPA